MAKSNYYVNNEALLQALINFKKMVEQARLNGLDRPVVPNSVAIDIMKIADGLGQKPKFANYPFIEDMKADGIKNAIEYIDNFNPDRFNNPFAYFTQIIYFAFIRRIDKEKRYLYTKFKVIDNVNLFEMSTGRHEHDTYDTSYNDMIQQSESTIEYMNNFVESYETRKLKKQEDKIKRATLDYEKNYDTDKKRSSAPVGRVAKRTPESEPTDAHTPELQAKPDRDCGGD